MKYGLILSIYCILLFSGIVFSQSQFISLSDETIDSPSNHYYVSDVINVTGEDRYIGFVLKKTLPEPVFLKEGIKTEIVSFLQNQFHEDEHLTQLIIRINKLFYFENPLPVYDAITKIVDLNCTFIIKDSTGYHDVFTGACSVSSKNQMRLPSNVIAIAFEKVFKQFHKRMQRGLLHEVQIQPKDLVYNPLKDSCYIQDQLVINRVRKGLFMTYYDFRDNTPDTTCNVIIKYKDKETELSDIMLHKAKLYHEYGEPIDDIWGFADGENVYWFVDDSYYLLEKDNESFYVGIAGRQDMNYARIGAVTGAGLGSLGNNMSGSIVGLVGGVLIGSLFNAASADLIKVNLNFSTGTNDSYLMESQKKVESTLLFYSSGFNKSKSGIKLRLNGIYCCTLLPNKWTTVVLPSTIKVIQASFITPNKEETLVDITPSLFKTDYYFCLEKKKQQLRITKADFEKREFINRSISLKNKVETNCFN